MLFLAAIETTALWVTEVDTESCTSKTGISLAHKF